MRASELAMSMVAMQEDLNLTIANTFAKLSNTFEAVEGTTNAEAEEGAERHNAMIHYIISSSLSSRFKKEAETSKKELDDLSDDSDGVPGQTRLIYQSNEFAFAKKQNNDSEITLVVDLVTALARAGVDKEVVDAALKEAKKPKRGNVYYQVTVVED